MHERGALSRVSRRDSSDDEECKDVRLVHKTMMTKEMLACMLDTHFVEENPMVIGHDETWLVMMRSDECTDDGW